MLSVVAPGWELQVERGPDGLWIKVNPSEADGWNTPPLAEAVWSVMQRHLAHRLVLELDEIELLTSDMIGQIVVLHRRIRERGGLLRITGLSPYNQEVLRMHGLSGRFALYDNLEEAVMAGHPRKPK